jgi:hypothetical protein
VEFNAEFSDPKLDSAIRFRRLLGKYRCVKNPILRASIFGYNTATVKVMPPSSAL